jgi:diguanylate cyclase (GGDEF)-like protein
MSLPPPEATPSTETESRLERAQRELNVLYEISCAMRTTLELNHILYIIVTGVTAHSGLGYNRAILYLVNPEKQCLECKMAIGPDSGEHANKIWNYIENANQDLEDLIQADKASFAINQSSLYKKLKDITYPLHTSQKLLLSDAYQRRSPWHLTPEMLENYTLDPLFKYFKTHELLIMPMRAKETVNGIILADNIYTQKPISTEDVRIFTMLANQAGLAIENSRLYEMVVTKSHTDSITDLWNHGYFQSMYQQLLKRAREENRALSLIIIDIDNFKILNDTYGHQTGDQILKDVATILKRSSREMDYVCRYGGEEFAIILVDTTKEQGFEIAERIRQNIERTSFRPSHIPFVPKVIAKERSHNRSSDDPLGAASTTPQDISLPQPRPEGNPALEGAHLGITVSIGLSSFPDDGETAETLIAKADKAMYIAKFSGKNKTCIAESDLPL